MPPWFEPVTLEGRHARLEPLATEHAEGLYLIGQEPSIWTWMPRGPLTSLMDAEKFIAQSRNMAETGPQVAFAIIDCASNRIAGSTRFMTIVPSHRRLEIGWTWLGVEFQRTAINTECKYLLLRHAFEHCNAARVELKTDAMNERSQRAIERIGAQREGVLRSHMTRPDSSRRDTVYYGIIAEDWPGVKAGLEGMMADNG